MFELFKKFKNAVDNEFNRQIDGTEYIIRHIQAKGKIDTQDFKGIIYSCPPLIMLLRNYLLNASTQEIGEMVKRGDLNYEVVVMLYKKLNLDKKK